MREAVRLVGQKPLTKLEHARLVGDNTRLKRQLEAERAARLANEAELHCAGVRLGALSRLIRTTLACGQLEKLEDARRHLSPSNPYDAVEATIDPDAYCPEHGCPRSTCDESHEDQMVRG